MPKNRKPLLIGFIGSPRKNGNTAHIVRYALGLVTDRQISTKEIRLSDLKPILCGTQCNYECLRKQNCPVEDDVYEVYRSFSEADALVVGCPAYGKRLPALMYAFFQRAQGWSKAWPLTDKLVALFFLCDEKYDCQPGKRDLEDFFGWKSRLIANVTVATPQIDPPPSKENYVVVKEITKKLLDKLLH